MPTEIYMDTARLGRMCRGARLAEQNFGTCRSVRLVAVLRTISISRLLGARHAVAWLRSGYTTVDVRNGCRRCNKPSIEEVSC